MIGPDEKPTREEMLSQEAELKRQIAELERFQRDLKERTPAPTEWTPDNPRKDDPMRCKCGATIKDQWCYCSC